MKGLRDVRGVAVYGINPQIWVDMLAPALVNIAFMVGAASVSLWLKRVLRERARWLEMPLQTALGLVMTFYVPDVLVKAYGTTEVAHHYFVGCISAYTFFRFAQVIFGRFNKGTDERWLPFVLFMAIPGAEVRFGPDGRPVRATEGRWRERLLGSLQAFISCAFFFSIIPHLPDNGLGHLIVAYCKCCIFAGNLALLTNAAAALIGVIFGFEVEDCMRSPMVLSQGINDFWGRRWNRTVHGFLRKLFFEPVLEHVGNRLLATLAAFLASALFHEALVVWTIFKIEPAKRAHVRGALGMQLLFFVCQGGLAFAERTLDRAAPSLGKLARALPYFAHVFVTACFIAPFGFLFIEPVERAGLVASLGNHYPTLVPVWGP